MQRMAVHTAHLVDHRFDQRQRMVVLELVGDFEEADRPLKPGKGRFYV